MPVLCAIFQINEFESRCKIEPLLSKSFNMTQKDKYRLSDSRTGPFTLLLFAPMFESTIQTNQLNNNFITNFFQFFPFLSNYYRKVNKYSNVFCFVNWKTFFETCARLKFNEGDVVLHTKAYC